MKQIFMHFLRIFGLLLPLTSFATEPLIDRFQAADQNGIIFSDECCWLELPESPKLKELRIEGLNCSAAGSPVGVFELREDKIWLARLYKCGGYVELNEVYDDMKSPMFAQWLTGTFHARLTFSHRDDDGAPIYESEWTLVVDGGVVVSKITKP